MDITVNVTESMFKDTVEAMKYCLRSLDIEARINSQSEYASALEFVKLCKEIGVDYDKSYVRNLVNFNKI